MRLTKSIIACTIAITALCGCNQYEYKPEYVQDLKSKLPDFSMHYVENINVNFGASNAGAIVHFTPEEKGIETETNIFLDENGCFKGKFLSPKVNGKGWIRELVEPAMPGTTKSWKRTIAMNPQHGFYAFEDGWSTTESDFDLNDVIVEYCYSDSIVQEYDASKGKLRTYLDQLVINIKPRHMGTDRRDGFSLQLPEQITTLYRQGKVKSIRVNGGAEMKDEQAYWKSLSKSNSDITGNLIDISSFEARFTYEFFHNILDEREGNSYTLIVQFETQEGKAITPKEWNSLCHPEGATDNRMNEYMMRWNYNPYITVYNLSLENIDNDGCANTEVHLPLYPVTEDGIPLAGGPGNAQQTQDWSLWYISATNAGVNGSISAETTYYPYALNIPYDKVFLPSREGMKIINSYSSFILWLKGGGNTDWYRSPYAQLVQPFTLDKRNWKY